MDGGRREEVSMYEVVRGREKPRGCLVGATGGATWSDLDAPTQLCISFTSILPIVRSMYFCARHQSTGKK